MTEHEPRRLTATEILKRKKQSQDEEFRLLAKAGQDLRDHVRDALARRRTK